MAQPQTISLPSVYEGTTWRGIGSITLQRPAGTALNLSGAQLRMTYRRIGERLERLTLALGSGIEITNATGGVFRVLAQVLPLVAGLYCWEIVVTLAGGEIIALFVGTQEITKNRGSS
jgi:hypothetical protein